MGLLRAGHTEQIHFRFSLSCTGEGNGNPFLCSCLENPRDEGAWWAAIYGVAQSGTRLKRLSSSSSSKLQQASVMVSKGSQSAYGQQVSSLSIFGGFSICKTTQELCIRYCGPAECIGEGLPWGGSVLGMPWRALLVCRLQSGRASLATASPAFLWVPVPLGVLLQRRFCYRDDAAGLERGCRLCISNWVTQCCCPRLHFWQP